MKDKEKKLAGNGYHYLTGKDSSYLPDRYTPVIAVIEIRDGSPTPEYDTTQAFRNGADEWIADNYNGQNEKIHLKVVAWMPVPKYKPSEQL